MFGFMMWLFGTRMIASLSRWSKNDQFILCFYFYRKSFLSEWRLGHALWKDQRQWGKDNYHHHISWQIFLLDWPCHWFHQSSHGEQHHIQVDLCKVFVLPSMQKCWPLNFLLFKAIFGAFLWRAAKIIMHLNASRGSGSEIHLLPGTFMCTTPEREYPPRFISKRKVLQGLLHAPHLEGDLPQVSVWGRHHLKHSLWKHTLGCKKKQSV